MPQRAELLAHLHPGLLTVAGLVTALLGGVGTLDEPKDLPADDKTSLLDLGAPHPGPLPRVPLLPPNGVPKPEHTHRCRHHPHHLHALPGPPASPSQWPGCPAGKLPRASASASPGICGSSTRRSWGLCPVFPSLLAGQGSEGSSRPAAPSQGKPATCRCIRHCSLPWGTFPPLVILQTPAATPSSDKPPSSTLQLGMGADLVCPEQGASSSLPSSSGLGLPALRAQNEASRQKHPGWQGQPASCGGMKTGRGRWLPEGRGQGHMSSQQVWCPPPTASLSRVVTQGDPTGFTGQHRVSLLCPCPSREGRFCVLDNTGANEPSRLETGLKSHRK